MCDCKKHIEAEIAAAHAAKNAGGHSHGVELQGYVICLGPGPSYRPAMTYKASSMMPLVKGGEKLRVTTGHMLMTFCPFCGERVVPIDPLDRWPADKYSDRQREWCVNYERETDFEPLMCDYEGGAETFVEAARKSIQWYEGHASDTHLRITSGVIPGDELDDQKESTR